MAAEVYYRPEIARRLRAKIRICASTENKLERDWLSEKIEEVLKKQSGEGS